MRPVRVHIEGASTPASSWQCPAGHVRFDAASAQRVVDELRGPLRIHQRIIRLSKERLGIYLAKDVIQSLGLRGGEEIAVSVPSATRIHVEIMKPGTEAD